VSLARRINSKIFLEVCVLAKFENLGISRYSPIFRQQNCLQNTENQKGVSLKKPLGHVPYKPKKQVTAP
jgi:hypothetical protein